MNPCPCGYYGDLVKACTCAPSTVTKYQKRISGPLLDRIDIHVEVPRVEYQKLSDDRLGESSDRIRSRVEAARQTQRERFAKPQVGERANPRRDTISSIMANADMRVAEIRQFCKLDGEGESLVRAAMGQMNLSARGYHRVLKLARTIADLAGSAQIEAAHLAEALQYRPRVMMA
jgi:magnesium chelatase family protein